MPLNADGRAKALSYDIAALSATERQCQMYPPFYAVDGPFPLQISIEQEPVTTEAARVEDRRLGRSRRHDDLDGRTAASVAVRAAFAWRLHDGRRGKATR